MDAVAQAIVTTSVAVRVPKKSAEIIRLPAWRQDPNSSFSLNLAARPQLFWAALQFVQLSLWYSLFLFG